MAVDPNTSVRTPGLIQGIMLLLPITMAVAGVMVFAATAALTVEHFKDLPHAEYLVQLMITMPAIWIVLFCPIAGWLADRYGRRHLLIASMIGYAIVGTLPFFLENLYLILLTRCAVGICEAFVMTMTTTMICDYFKSPARERWLASQTAMASVSALLIIWVGGQLGAAFGWKGPFLVYLHSLVLVFGIVLYTWEPAKEATTKSIEPDGEIRYRELPRMRILGICSVTVIASIMFYATITQNANAFAALGVNDPRAIGNFSALASLGVPIGAVVFWWLGRLHIGWLLAIDFGLIGIGFALMGSAETPAAYTWAANIHQIGGGLLLPTLYVWATRGLAFEIRGRVTGLWQAAFAVGQFISGMALTFLSREMGGLLPTFSILAVVCIGASLPALSSGFMRYRGAVRMREA